MSRGGVRLVLRLTWGEDFSLRLVTARYVERGKIIRPAMTRRCAVELLEEWADQERREAEARARLQTLGWHPVRALLAVAAELRDMRAADARIRPGRAPCRRAARAGGELQVAIAAVPPAE